MRRCGGVGRAEDSRQDPGLFAGPAARFHPPATAGASGGSASEEPSPLPLARSHSRPLALTLPQALSLAQAEQRHTLRPCPACKFRLSSQVRAIVRVAVVGRARAVAYDRPAVPVRIGLSESAFPRRTRHRRGRGPVDGIGKWEKDCGDV
jgi:hypothetical protein